MGTKIFIEFSNSSHTIVQQLSQLLNMMLLSKYFGVKVHSLSQMDVDMFMQHQGFFEK